MMPDHLSMDKHMNDGAIVVALVQLMGVLAYGTIKSVEKFNAIVAANDATTAAQVRLTAAMGNIANAVIHFMYVWTLYSENETYLNAGMLDAENIVGPAALVGTNLIVGLISIFFGSTGRWVSFIYNTLVAIAGSFLPVVW